MAAIKRGLEITLRYSGPDVDDGTMSLDDLVPVLQGFGGAYNKVAAAEEISTQHRLRLVGLEHGSAKLLLDVWQTVTAPGQIESISTVVNTALGIVGTIITIIKIKKHTKGEPYRTRINGSEGSIVIVNSKNISISIPPRDYQIFKDNLIDSDLSRVARPLEKGRIDSSELIVTNGDCSLAATLHPEDRALFESTQTSVTVTKETWLMGKINSMTKSTNTGQIYLNDGSRVHFRIKTEEPSHLWEHFSYKGLVKVRCVAHMDENLRPVELDVYEIVPIQSSLFESQSETESKHAAKSKQKGWSETETKQRERHRLKH
jgi:hypothetical protein